MSLGKFLPPQDLEDTQLSDKGEDTRRLSRRNLTKASSWWQVGSCLDLQYTRCMMLVPGDARPSPGPMTFTPQFKDGHIGAQKDEQPPESGQEPPLSAMAASLGLELSQMKNQPSKDHLSPVRSANNHLLSTARGDIFEGQPAWQL